MMRRSSSQRLGLLLKCGGDLPVELVVGCPLGGIQVRGHQGLEEVQGFGRGRLTRLSSPSSRNWRLRLPML